MKKVIIIGGGIAGLAAAHVLSDFCPEILIIERDALPETPETRPGKDFMQAAAKIVAPAWWMNAVSDTGHPQVAHHYTTSQQGLHFAHVFMEQTLQLAVNFNQPALFGLVWLVRTSFLSPGELINRHMLYMLREAGLAGPLDQLIQSGEVSDIQHWYDDRCPDIPDFAAELFIPREV